MSAYSQPPTRLPEELIVIVLLLSFWVVMLLSLRHTTMTSDEGAHAAAGYTYWRFNDYRFDPENANLAQRVMALPLLFGNYKFPPLDSHFWQTSHAWELAWQWFYNLGNDADAMVRRGRAACGLLAVALGFLVWRWSRQLFGPIGGMISLLLCVLNPSILANGALMTSDTAAALFFLAAIWAFWRMLHRFTVGRLITSGLAMGGVFLAKMSGVLIVPMALVLFAATIIRSSSLPIIFFGLKTDLRSRSSRLIAFAIGAVGHIVIVVAMIWAFYGFRYTAFSPQLPSGRWSISIWEGLLGKPPPGELLSQVSLSSDQREQIQRIFKRDKAEEESWSEPALKALNDAKNEVLNEEQGARLEQLIRSPSPKLVGRVLEIVRHYRLLPEAYIYGFAHSWRHSLERAAFLNGEFSLFGFHTFFPYTFLVKTPLAVFVVIAIAFAAAIHQLRRIRSNRISVFLEGLHETLPLWALLAIYWTTAISSHLNIGHRHILPTYPPLFVLCGAAGYWFSAQEKQRSRLPHSGLLLAPRGVLIFSVVVLAGEMAYRFPYYLAYFNGIVRPAEAYQHLVDSSLDWGQDLPRVSNYIERKHPPKPIYLSYFGGVASPVYYHIPATLGYCAPDRFRRPPMHSLVFPADQADRLLYEFFQREPEYDDQVFGRVRQGDQVFVAVIKKPTALRLTAGTYIISATLLQPVTHLKWGTFGHWNVRLEKQYQSAKELTKGLLSDDPTERTAMLPQLTPEKWNIALTVYDRLRFYRLAAFLRHRKPDDNIGYSMLVYYVTDSDLSLALDGPPPELGRDLLQERYGAPHTIDDDTP